MNFEKYFAQLLDWKKLPAYKLETRIDSYIGYYLRGLLKEFTGKNIIDIIPEFPLRIGTIYPNIDINKSFKVDFLAISEVGCHYLIEFKTDSKSRRTKQDNYLAIAKERKLRLLLDGLKKIYEATATEYIDKYRHLINKFIELKIIDNKLEYIYKKSDDLDIIYVQPSNLDKHDNIIDFDFIIKYINNNYDNDSFEQEFVKVLSEWKND
jgi:hypothetical protein